MTLPWSLGPCPSDLCHILARLSPCKSPVPWDRSSWVSGVIPSRILLSCPCLYLASVAPLSILSLRSGFAPFTEGAPRKVSGFFPPVKIRLVESGGPRSGAPPGLAGRVRDKGPVAPFPQFPLGPHGGARWAGTRGPRHLCTPDQRVLRAFPPRSGRLPPGRAGLGEQDTGRRQSLWGGTQLGTCGLTGGPHILLTPSGMQTVTVAIAVPRRPPHVILGLKAAVSVLCHLAAVRPRRSDCTGLGLGGLV